jgi:predicted amidohydrolase
VRKAFPISIELPFTTPAPVAELPAFDTPAGRLGVLICADSWYPAAYERLRAHGVELIAVPSDGVTKEAWEGLWRGYDGAPAPADVDPADVGVLTEAQAWRKYALAGRISQAGARCGINVFLRGELWDLGAHGGCATVVGGAAVIEAKGSGAALLNLWL